MVFNLLLKEKLKNADFKEEYENFAPEYEIISTTIQARKESGYTQRELAQARKLAKKMHISFALKKPL